MSCCWALTNGSSHTTSSPTQVNIQPFCSTPPYRFGHKTIHVHFEAGKREFCLVIALEIFWMIIFNWKYAGFLLFTVCIEVTAAILTIVYMKDMPMKLRGYMAENLRSNYTGTFYDRQFDRSVDWTQTNVGAFFIIFWLLELVSKFSLPSMSAVAWTHTGTTRTATTTTRITSTVVLF